MIFDQGIYRKWNASICFERRGKLLTDAINASPQGSFTEPSVRGNLCRFNVSEVLGSPPLAAIFFRCLDKSLKDRESACSFKWQEFIDKNTFRYWVKSNANLRRAPK